MWPLSVCGGPNGPRSTSAGPILATSAITSSIMPSMPLIDAGKKAPAFSLPDQEGKTHSLEDYAGKPLVLYFYPKDDTPGCTKEACNFQSHLPNFKKVG